MPLSVNRQRASSRTTAQLADAETMEAAEVATTMPDFNEAGPPKRGPEGPHGFGLRARQRPRWSRLHLGRDISLDRPSTSLGSSGRRLSA